MSSYPLYLCCELCLRSALFTKFHTNRRSRVVPVLSVSLLLLNTMCLVVGLTVSFDWSFKGCFSQPATGKLRVWKWIACETALTDDTLIIVSLEPVKIVAKLKRKSLRALGKSGHHSVPGRNQGVSGVVHSARLCAVCQHSPSGACKILTTWLLLSPARFRIQSWALSYAEP